MLWKVHLRDLCGLICVWVAAVDEFELAVVVFSWLLLYFGVWVW